MKLRSEEEKFLLFILPTNNNILIINIIYIKKTLSKLSLILLYHICYKSYLLVINYLPTIHIYNFL